MTKDITKNMTKKYDKKYDKRYDKKYDKKYDKNISFDAFMMYLSKYIVSIFVCCDKNAITDKRSTATQCTQKLHISGDIGSYFESLTTPPPGS